MKPKKEVQFEQPSDLLLIVNKYIMAIGGLVVIVILSLGYVFLLRPKLADIQVVQDESSETQERKLQNENLLTKIKELKNEYEDIKNNRTEDLERLRDVVPNDPQIAEIFVISERLALEKGFQLLSINITESKEQVSDTVRSEEEPQFDQSEGLLDAEILDANLVADVDSLTLDSYKPKSEDVASKIGLKFLTIHLSLVRIKDIAAVNEEVIDDWGLDEEGKEQLLQDLENNIELTSYKAFKDYLAALEYYLRLSDVDAVSFGPFQEAVLTKEGAEGDGEEVESFYGDSFNIDITTYFRKDNE
ncbi:hypothetical protein HON36_06205 [Candidatus Parcubacteria bacterium]|jgi:hypothetical protein|nr:hypothetical protein [Candidatus Parcubacteria bacterium]MBT7228055.1 hypothetical protein [Candidatus Parcubacteria bacterium]